MKDLIQTELIEFWARGTGEPPPATPSQGGDLASRLDVLVAAQGLPRAEFLRRFGCHLFGRFAALMPVFVAGDDSALDFLMGLEARVHEELRILGPGLAPPRLECTRSSPDELVLVYRSGRGLADLAEGMLLGCAEHFGEDLAITREPLKGEAGERFVVRRRA